METTAEIADAEAELEALADENPVGEADTSANACWTLGRPDVSSPLAADAVEEADADCTAVLADPAEK